MDEQMLDAITGKGELQFNEVTRLRFFGIPWPFTRFLIYENDLVRRHGLLNIREDDLLLYRITDVRINRSLLQRIFGLSTVECLSSDVTDKVLVMKNIRHGMAVKDYLVMRCEKCRILRRTVNMQEISYNGEENQADAMDDNLI